MKFLQSTLLLGIISVFFFSCSKDTANYGNMTGKLVAGPSGECQQVNVHGKYYELSGFTDENYIDVQVDVLATGLYNLATDTVNGMYFSGSGRVGYGGLNTIRLYPGDSIPKAPGLTSFEVYFNDSTNTIANTCTFDVDVLDPFDVDNMAVFTLGSTPGNCTGASIGGVYKAGVDMTVTNTVTIQVNVLGTGGFDIHTATINGVTFSAQRVFYYTGVQNVILTGTGTPTESGIFNFPVSAASGTCSFSLAFGS